VLGWDRDLDRWVVGHRVGFLNPVAEGLSFVGTSGLVWLAIALAIALVRARPGVFAWTLAADALAALTTNGLKEAVDRARPDVAALVGRPLTSSFPSGHTSTSFACATVLGAFVPQLRVPFFVLAAAVGWSRVYVGVHYPLDVLAGAFWGVLVGLLVLRALPRLATALRRPRPAPPPG
jgi:undecaprenyl-diphosphatase